MYEIKFEKCALKDFESLSKRQAEKIAKQVAFLKENPRPPGTKKLKGRNSLYRVRVGDYRIVYAVEDDVCVILIVRVGHRKEIYKHLG